MSEFHGWERSAEEIALTLFAVLALQVQPLFFGFGPFATTRYLRLFPILIMALTIVESSRSSVIRPPARQVFEGSEIDPAVWDYLESGCEGLILPVGIAVRMLDSLRWPVDCQLLQMYDYSIRYLPPLRAKLVDAPGPRACAGPIDRSLWTTPWRDKRLLPIRARSQQVRLE
jgi:hypothetical protein